MSTAPRASREPMVAAHSRVRDIREAAPGWEIAARTGECVKGLPARREGRMVATDVNGRIVDLMEASVARVQADRFSIDPW